MVIESITEDNIIDTTKEENLIKYKNNLNLLINQAKSKGSIDKFVIIRNDDFFPDNFMWSANSKCTNGEYRVLLRYNKNNENLTKKSFFDKFFHSRKKDDTQKVQQINEVLKLYYPTQFRSTKHFTVNTALEYTGEYNLVPYDRPFTVIDDINNFLSSGYGYSLSSKDAYLDVTHEPLKISDNAIILISIDTYNKLKEDKELMKKMMQRKLVIYKGDLTLAINMLLTENGILPTRVEQQYDPELTKIIENSLKKICSENNLEYDRPHGLGGHFTSYIDQYDNTSNEIIIDFVNYINSVLDNNLVEIEKIERYKETAWYEYIEIIGLERFKVILNDFNNIQKQQLLHRKQEYEIDRSSITPDISNLFKETIRLIIENEDKINFISNYNDLTKTVIKFYLSPDVASQEEAALELKRYFNEYKSEDQKQH